MNMNKMLWSIYVFTWFSCQYDVITKKVQSVMIYVMDRLRK